MRWKRGNRLRLISEGDAPPRTREIFDEVRHSLGVPLVPVLYQAYAAFPQFLELHWQSFRPALESRQFFTCGARVAAESYTRVHNYFHIASLTTSEAHSDVQRRLPVSQVLDYYQYLDPLLLLVAATQMQAFEGPVGHAGAPEPPNRPSFPVAPDLLQEDQASAAVQRIWEDRRRILEASFVSNEHRALACWPDFYQQFWVSLKDNLHSPVYADCQYRIGESAWTMVRELPVRVETEVSQLLDGGMDGEALSSLVRINEAFMQAMTGLVLDITIARIACDGGTQVKVPPQKEPTSTPTTARKKTKSRTRAA